MEQQDSTTATSARSAASAAKSGTSSALSGSGSTGSTPFTVRLYDTYGVEKLQQTTTTPTVQLSTGSLPTGLYLLHIEAGGVLVESRHIQITH